MTNLAYFPHPLATVSPRDLMLLELLEPRRTDTALEIGTGSGSSLLRFRQFVRTMHGADVARAPVERLRRFLPRFRESGGALDVFVLDFCDSTLPERVSTRYDLIFSCDTVEHVPHPDRFFANVYQLLKPGGRAFITFPNERPARAHGITFFDGRSTLEALLTCAGFAPDQIDIKKVSMCTGARRILRSSWETPGRAAKRALAAINGRSGLRAPQTFDETTFFSLAEQFEPLAPILNAYSWVVLQLMSMMGPVFRASRADEEIWDTQVLIRATRPHHRMAGS